MILAFLQRNRPAPLLFDIYVTLTLSLYKRDLQTSSGTKELQAALYCTLKLPLCMLMAPRVLVCLF